MVEGFAGFGFPKAHGAAFGLLAYQSTWLRVHYGPEFLCALLNEQPMGFYAPDTLVHEAEVRGIPCSGSTSTPRGWGARWRTAGVRLGLGYVKGVRADQIRELVAERERGGLPRPRGVGRTLRRGAADARAARVVRGLRRRWWTTMESLDARRRLALWQLGVVAPGHAVGEEGTQLALPLGPPRRRACVRSPAGSG